MTPTTSTTPRLGRRLVLWLLPALGLLLAGVARGDGADEPREVPPIVLPQARIDSVDLSEFPKVRVLATVLDRNARPVQLKAIKKLTLVDGKRKSAPAYIGFQLGQPLDGRKDGKLLTAGKVGVGHAIVMVVAGYQDPALRNGSLGRRLKEAVVTAFKPLGDGDRVNLVWYNDRIYRYVGLKGRTGELTDLEESRSACLEARAEALSGEPVPDPSGAADKPLPPGTDLCGLFGDAKPIVDLVKGQQTAFEGYFPRLFNLGLPFYSHTRYCKPPREALQKFGEFTPENVTLQLEERERRKLKGETLDWETSAFDEALRMLLQDGRAAEQKAIVLVSDGRDGYFRDLDLCQENPPNACAAIEDRHQQTACIKAALKQRLILQQSAFKEQARHWIGVARAAGIRVFSVGMEMLGEPFELERLRLLSERTGGTYRVASREESLAGALSTAMAEITGQLAIEFVHQTPEEVEDELTFRLAVEMDPSMVRGDTKVTSDMALARLPPKPTWREQAERTVLGLAAKLQDTLGYKVYVGVGIAVAALASLLLLLVFFLIVRKIVRAIAG